MKTAFYSFSILFVSMFLLFACGNQDKKAHQNTDHSSTEYPEVSPEVVFENDYTRVVKVTLAPAESLAAHEGNERVIYSLSDYTIDWVEHGKNEGAKSWKKGDIHYHGAGHHSARNIGGTTAEWLAFTTKGTALPDCDEKTSEKDIHSVAPDFAQLKLDNKTFRVTEVSLPGGMSIPMHAGFNRIIYALSDYQVMYASEEEARKERAFREGDMHWHNACQHALENTGETGARFLVVSYKGKTK